MNRPERAMPVLPMVRDRAHFSELFKGDHWNDAISLIAKKHGLTGTPQRGALGSHIVYRVGNFWIKIMAPLFAKDMTYEMAGLKAVDGRLSVPSPKVVGEGTIEAWRYVILTHVEGKPIRDAWKNYSSNEKVRLAEQIARITKEMNQCPADVVIQQRFDWNQFIANQFNNFEEQQLKKSLPQGWLRKLGEFLHSFDLEEFETSNPVFLHADLTFDHFLVANDGSAEITGVIDMADCQIGHFEYELVAPCTFIFKSEPTALKKFLLDCGYQAKDLNQRFSEKLLVWAILHRFFSLVTWFKDEMDAVGEGEFSKLAELVFPL